MIDRSNQMLKQVRFDGWNPYSYHGGPVYIEFIDRKSGSSDAVCTAQVESHGTQEVSFEVSCSDAKTQGPLAAYKQAIAEITLTEFVDATLSGRSLDQANVDAAFAKLDLGGLGQDDLAVLKAQASFGKKGPKPGEANRRAAREQYANHYNRENGGDAGWSADGAFNATD